MANFDESDFRALLDYGESVPRDLPQRERRRLALEAGRVLDEQVVRSKFGKGFKFDFRKHAGNTLTVVDRETLQVVGEAEGEGRGLTKREISKYLDDWKREGKIDARDYVLIYGVSANAYDSGIALMSFNASLGELVETFLHEPFHQLKSKGLPSMVNYDNSEEFPEAWQVEELAAEYATGMLFEEFVENLPGGELKDYLRDYKKTLAEMSEFEGNYFKRLKAADGEAARNEVAREFRKEAKDRFASEYGCFLSQIGPQETERIIPYLVFRGAYSEDTNTSLAERSWKVAEGDLDKYAHIMCNARSFEELRARVDWAESGKL